ncbi:hypothetical protein E1176_13905 [Fulvivirga sp. RKSG066]|uniref:hypothetical protein n=1 Tax=Fulvivirga aurantia TaxID=2529383 RepID=UPI0012BBF570|nr:hypothetical protein [Fulvivirga aurantia]MTI22120.1 hypothetical protein [Fulvivirga aurantia]
MNRLLVFVFLSLSISGFSQILQPDRHEIVLANDEKSYEVIACEKQGVMLWRTLNIPKVTDSLVFEVAVLDTTFSQVWQNRFLFNASLRFMAQKYHDGKAYLLFRNITSKTRNLRLIELEVRSGTVREHIIKNIIPFSYFDMEVTGESVVIGGYFNYRPLVLLFDFEERVPRILPGLFNDHSELVQMKVSENNTIDVIVKGRNAERVNTLYINTFDNNARLIKVIELQATRRRAPLFGRSKALEWPSQIVAGVYGRRNSEYSRGVFVANINDYGEQKIKYYNYAEFENFFKYMRAKREQRVKRRIERKRVKNKKIRFNYRLLVHELISYGDQYILLGEAFYPQYKSTPGSSGMFGSAWTVNRGLYSYDRIFVGFQYTHAVVIGLDKNGNILWDNSFEIKDVLSKQLQQFVHVSVGEDNVDLLYVFDDAIRSKVIRGNEVIEGKELVDIKLKYENDETEEKSTTIYGLQKWYDNVFVAFGEQSIKNMQQEGIRLKRDVFFLNKLVVH